MSISKEYSSSVRRELSRYAVWEPGQRVELGDYGVLRDRTFGTEGNISRFGVPAPKIKESTPSTFGFLSAGASIHQFGMDGSIATPGIDSVVPVNAALELKFTSSGGLFIRSAHSYTREIINLGEIATSLRRHPQWEFRWKIVSVVRIVSTATVLMSNSRDTAVRVEGRVDAIEHLQLGNLKSNSGLSFSGAVGYERLGVTGPLLIDLIRIRRFFGNPQRAMSSHSLSDEPFEPVPADLHVVDDC